MKVLETGTIYRSKMPEAAFCCFPSLCRLGNGDLLASFQCGPEKNHMQSTVSLARSQDGGVTWSSPVQPFRAWADAQGLTVHIAYLTEVAPGRILASLMLCDHFGDPALPMFHPETGGALPIKIGLSESFDGGREWLEPRLLDTGRFRDVPTAIMSPILRNADGMLLLPFETSKCYDDAGIWDHFAACIASTDNGKTWGEPIIVANDPQQRLLFWDHRMVALDGGGRLLDFFWVYTQAGEELTAHRSVSLDGGRSWPIHPTDTRLVGQPWPVPISGDAIAVITVDRHQDRAIKVTLSPDLGETWMDEMVVYRHPVVPVDPNSLVDSLNDMQIWSFGLPSGILIKPDVLMMVYYCGEPTNTHIAWARVSLD